MVSYQPIRFEDLQKDDVAVYHCVFRNDKDPDTDYSDVITFRFEGFMGDLRPVLRSNMPFQNGYVIPADDWIFVAAYRRMDDEPEKMTL